MITTIDSAGGTEAKELRRRSSGAAHPVDRLPPHSIEAEQGVLGCVLLSPNETLGETIQKFKAGSEVFYDLRHRTVYELLVEMYDKKEPIDIITVQQRLKDRQQLEAVGGLPYLAALPDAVPSAANLDYYQEIVREKYLLRKMIQTCTEVVGRVYEHEGEIDALLDGVEKDILHISEARVEAESTTIKDLVRTAIKTIEDYHQRQGALTGLGTGFIDFDKMTSGLHAGEMIVIAARPSMGKCLSADSEILLADGSIATIQEICRRKAAKVLTLQNDSRFIWAQPSAYVDDGVKPVFRVTTRLGRTVEATSPHPFLTVQGWKQLAELKPGVHIAVPRKLEVFGTSTSRECEIKLLAYLLGDGTLTGACPVFTNGNPELRADFAKAVADFGGLTTRLSDSGGTRTPSLRVVGDSDFIKAQRRRFGERLRTAIAASRRSARQIARAAGVSPVAVCEWQKGTSVPGSDGIFQRLCAALEIEPGVLTTHKLEAISRNSKNPLTLWLHSIGLAQCGAYKKFIPAFVFGLSKPQMALFLNRLFATDGWATLLAAGQSQIGYCSVSEKMARQIQHLLLRFGVIASLRKRKIKYRDSIRFAWQLDITDSRSIQTFVTEVGMFGKESACGAVLRATKAKRYQTNRDLVPREVWTLIAAAKGAESWAALARRANFKSHSNIHVGKRALSRGRLALFAETLDHAALRALAHSDIYWDEIVSIEPVGRKQVYDLTIPTTHNFVANDVCVHNTSLAMNIAEHVAVDQRLPVGVFSLEMTAESLVLRMLCSRSRMNLRNIREGFLAERDFPKLTNAAGKLAGAPLFIDDTPGLSILQMRAKARRMWQQYGIKLFVVDYLQLLHSTARRADNRQQEIADISNGIKSLAKELKVPVIVLSQLNREVEREKGRKPRMADLRESGAIEQDADLIGLLYKADAENRKKAATDDEEDEGRQQEAIPVNLLIAKQRNGPTGDVHLTFLKSITRFESAAKISNEDIPPEG